MLKLVISVFGILWTCLFLTPEPPAAASVDWPGLAPRDWDALDDELDRPLLVNRYMHADQAQRASHVHYRDLVDIPARFHPVTPEQFASLDSGEQKQRAAEADRLRRQVRSSLEAIDRVRDAGLDNEALRSLPDPRHDGGMELLPRAIGGLGVAVATDPRDPVAWYDLACFANWVGDEERQAEALAGFRLAVAAADAELQAALFELRINAELDQAWLHRRRGELEEGLAAVLEASRLMKGDPRANEAASQEARLVAALLHADCGDMDQAAILARPLTDLETRERNAQAHHSASGPSNTMQQSRVMPLTALTGPALWAKGIPSAYDPHVPAQTGAWESRRWPWARNWVLGLVELRQGNVEGALHKMGPFDPLVEFPGRLGYRLWNDRGRVCEAAGDRSGARRCNALAVVHRPFFIFYPIEGMRGLARTMNPAERGFSYFLGCGEYFGGGSLFSYAANCLLTWELETIPERKQRMEVLAERWLTACIRRHIRRPQALALRGRLHFLRANTGPAEVDLLQAAELNKKLGRQDDQVLLLLGLISFNLGDYAGARPWLEDFTRASPEIGVGWRALGLTRVFLNELDEGERALTRSLEVEPGNAGGWFNRALVRLKKGDRQGALADLDRAAELVPDNPDIPRIREAALEGPLPDVGLNPSPITLTASRQAARMLSRLQWDARLDLAAESDRGSGMSADSWVVDAERAEAELEELRRAYRYDPSPTNTVNLGRALLALDHPGEVQRMLVPHWEKEILPSGLILLLEADRRLGESARAISLAHNMTASVELYPEPEIWAQVGAICLAAGRHDLGRRALEITGRLGTSASVATPAAAD
jgi:tetratricopeptide (TPR) repeat protein